MLLSTLDVKVRDLTNLFYLLDDGDGQLGPGDFINGLQSIKGQAQALDLFTALQLIRRLERKVDDLADAVEGIPRRRDLRSYAVGSNGIATARFLVPGVLTPTARRRESGLG
uniref:EF-hand domain-containing protein n=1 Tax=Zooxanthella nutricula TaxID=1333877 RepID=A0A7S2L5M6_9DINO